MSYRYKEIEGVPVCGIDEILERTHPEEATIILTATKTNQYAIEKELEKTENHWDTNLLVVKEMNKKNIFLGRV